MKWLVTRYEDQTHRYEYEVEADSKEQAEKKVRDDECEPVRDKLTDSQTISIEAEVLL